MPSHTRQQISDETGFDQGEQFASDDEVRAYFTIDSMQEMMGSDADDMNPIELDVMADTVIEHGWHCDYRDLYVLTQTDGSPVESFDDWDDAVGAINARWPMAVYDHAGDLSEGGERTIVWATPEDAGPPGMGDDGASAVASVTMEPRA